MLSGLPFAGSRPFAIEASRSLAIVLLVLYHVLATSGMRQMPHLLGIHDVGLHLAAGLAAGIGVPILMHLAVMRHPVTRMLVLGKGGPMPLVKGVTVGR